MDAVSFLTIVFVGLSLFFLFILLVSMGKKGQTALSAERNKLAIVIAAITDGVIAVDLKRRIVIFNDAAQKLTGYSKKEALGKPIEETIEIFESAEPLDVSQYCPVRKDEFEGIVFARRDVKIIGKNKEAFVNFMAGKIKESDKVNLACILTLHDITEEKRLEKMKLDFVSMAAHELRTPLTSLQSYLAVFRQENKKVLNKDQKTFVTRMTIATSELINLVENLLSASRIERAKLTVALERVNLKELVSETVSELQDKAIEKDIKLVFVSAKTSLPHVLADRIRIKEVLVNLLVNAVAYTGKGGRVTVWLEKKKDSLVTHVKDSGVGIPKDAIEHLFTKFFRVSGMLEGGSKGTGLGLYISKAIMDLHHGKIWVESEVGKGTTFSFALPIKKHG